MTTSRSDFEKEIVELYGEYLEARELVCPQCAKSSIHYVYSRTDETTIDCAHCREFFRWHWRQERLTSPDGLIIYPRETYKNIV